LRPVAVTAGPDVRHLLRQPAPLRPRVALLRMDVPARIAVVDAPQVRPLLPPRRPLPRLRPRVDAPPGGVGVGELGAVGVGEVGVDALAGTAGAGDVRPLPARPAAGVDALADAALVVAADAGLRSQVLGRRDFFRAVRGAVLGGDRPSATYPLT
jgi:hypothetical protein